MASRIFRCFKDSISRFGREVGGAFITMVFACLGMVWFVEYRPKELKSYNSGYYPHKGNGQKRELPVLFGQRRMYPENNSCRECCRPYLIGQHPLSPVLGQKRPGTPGNSYFAQLPPVFGHFMFLSGGLLDYSNSSTWATRTINSKISPR